MTREELENEIFISVIRNLLFFLFMNRARDPPCTTLEDGGLTTGGEEYNLNSYDDVVPYLSSQLLNQPIYIQLMILPSP